MVSVSVDCAKLVFGQNISFSAMREGGRGKKERERETERREGRHTQREGKEKEKKEKGEEGRRKRGRGEKKGRKKNNSKKPLIGSVLRHSHNAWPGHIKLYLNFHFLHVLSLYISQR